MRAYLLYGAGDLRPEERTVPQPPPGSVIVEPRFTGVCGSDVHYFQHGYCGRFVPKRPFALGHEFAGVVRELGAGVTTLSLGEEVAVDPSMPCGVCAHCRSGRYNLCPDMRYFGSASCDPHLDGSMAQFVSVPVGNCHRLPPGISLSQASLLEPLSVAMHAVRQGGSVAGRNVLVTGGGPIGQLILRVARAFGAWRITVSDPDPFARQFAVQHGADAAIDPLSANAWKGQDGFDTVFEASGSPAALSNAIEAAARGGTLVLVGTLPERVEMPANLIMNRELNLRGSFRFANVFGEALRLVAAGIIPLDGLVTQVFPYEETPQAMRVASSRQSVMKVQIAS
jgi:2-desacetyl-2-hydroxyethyl bacteriochlorophyllide A dehydrogenase